ncbi:MAG: hypothetical protein WAU33_20245 [Candidatus Binataceae bacterium]
MMIDLVNAFGREIRPPPMDLFDQRIPGKDCFVKQRTRRVETENLSKRLVIEAMRDFVDVAEG